MNVNNNNRNVQTTVVAENQPAVNNRYERLVTRLAGGVPEGMEDTQAAGQVLNEENQALIITFQSDIQAGIKNLEGSFSTLMGNTNRRPEEELAKQIAARESMNDENQKQSLIKTQLAINPSSNLESVTQQVTGLLEVIKNQTLPSVEKTEQLTEPQRNTLEQIINNLKQAQTSLRAIYNILYPFVPNFNDPNTKAQLQDHFNKMINDFVNALQLWKDRDFLSEIRIINDPRQQNKQLSITMINIIKNAIDSYSLELNLDNLENLINDDTM